MHAADCAENVVECSIRGDVVKPDDMERHNEEHAHVHVTGRRRTKLKCNTTKIAVLHVVFVKFIRDV